MICRFYPRARTCVLFLAFQHRGMAEIAMNNSRFPNRIWTVHAKTLCFARRPIHLSTLRLSRYFRFPPLCGFAMPSICSSFSTRSAVDRHPRFRGSNRVKFVPTFNCLAIGALARITTHQSTIPNVLLRCQPFSETIFTGGETCRSILMKFGPRNTFAGFAARDGLVGTRCAGKDQSVNVGSASADYRRAF